MTIKSWLKIVFLFSLIIVTTGQVNASDVIAVQVLKSPSNSGISPKIPLTAINHIIPKLIFCESGGKNQKIVDINGKWSYGVLMIQSSTAKWFNEEAGTDLDPMRPQEAIELAISAIQHGHLNHWYNCSRKLSLLTMK